MEGLELDALDVGYWIKVLSLSNRFRTLLFLLRCRDSLPLEGPFSQDLGCRVVASLGQFELEVPDA